MKRVYVAGPLTSSGSVAENIHNAIRALQQHDRELARADSSEIPPRLPEAAPPGREGPGWNQGSWRSPRPRS